MPIGQDGTYAGQSRLYEKQQPAGTTFNGNAVITEVVEDTGCLTNRFGLNAVNGKVTGDQALFTIAQGGAANICQITIQMADNGGQPIANQAFDLDVILSDAANGVGVTATGPSGGLAVTGGTQLNIYVAGKALYAQANASGQLIITITDTAKTGYYVMVQGAALPFAYVSRQLLAADYHP